jgi:hypothetical protein
MSDALDYLVEDKKQELKAKWLKNTFVRYKIINTRNSLSEAILRSTHRGEYKRSYRELEKFYDQIKDNLIIESKNSSEDIYMKIFKEDKVRLYMRKNNIVLVKDKDKKDDLRKLGFYFKGFFEGKFYFFPKEIRNLKSNCNLMKYLASIDINLPYNYFRMRFKEKLEYAKIDNNVKEINEEKNIGSSIGKDKELCDQTVKLIREKRLLYQSYSFSKNLFSEKKKEDYKFYLFLYPKIFNINFMIFIPFKNDKIVVQNIIEENPNFPYLILFQPLETKSFYFKIELGAILVDRRLHFLLDPKTDSEIIETIKDRYYNKENNLPIINYLKYQQDRKYSKYLKDYDFDKKESGEIYDLLDRIKYYSYEF